MEAKDFGVKKAISTNMSMGLTQFIIFATYALAFWYGTKLSVDEPENYTIGRVLTVSLCNFFIFIFCFIKTLINYSGQHKNNITRLFNKNAFV